MARFIARGSNGLRHLLSMGVVGLMVAAGVAVPQGVARAGESLSGEARALQQAQRLGVPVDVPELTTETTSVVANPDGSFTAEVHGGVTRFKDSSGRWVKVNLDLERRADGLVAPKAHPRSLILAGAAGDGEHDLARLTVDGHEVALGWRGRLPEPVLEGTKATYVDAVAGVDLIVQVTRYGFEQFLVVKSRDAAASVASVAMPWRAEGLTARKAAGRGLEYVNGKGAVLAAIPVARMWDSRVPAKSAEPVAHAPVVVSRGVDLPASARRPAAIGGTPKADDLVLIPDTAFLSNADTVYPVTIDPQVETKKPNFDAFIQNSYSSDQSGSDMLKLGKVTDGGTYIARSHLRYDNLSGYWDSTVSSATLYLWNWHSWSCTASSWEAWRTDYASTSTRWSNPVIWREKVGTSTLTKGYSSSCGDGWVTIDVKKALQTSFTSHWSTASIGLKASSETSDLGWKKFDSMEGTNDPYVSLTYNKKPLAPTDLYAGNKLCALGMTVSTTAGQPTLQAKVTDPNSQDTTLTAKFFLAEQGAALPSSPTVTKTATSGTTATVTVPTTFMLTEGKSYYWQAIANDGTIDGPASATCTFKVDNGTLQKAPVVTSADGVYPKDGSGGGPGVSGKFTFAPNGVTTVNKYKYRTIYQGVTSTWVELSVTAGASAMITWSPPYNSDHLGPDGVPIPLTEINAGGPLKVEVKMGDASLGWFNNTETFLSTVGAAPGMVAHWTMNDEDGATVLVDEIGRSETVPNGTFPATPANLTKSADGFGDYGTAWTFNGTSSSAVAASPFDSSKSFSFAAWVRLADKNDDYGVLSKEKVGGTLPVGLWYNKAFDEWLVEFDDGNGWLESTAKPKVGVWTHLALSWEAGTQTVRLYVNGVLDSTKGMYYPPGNNAADQWWIGKAWSDYWHGDIDDVRIWPRAIDPVEVAMLATAEVASWGLDSSLVATQTSPFEQYTLTAFDNNGSVDITSNIEDPAQASWWTGVGHTPGDGGSIVLDAATERRLELYPQVPAPVVRTDQAFSASTWVHLDTMPTGADGKTWTALGQDGVCRSGFFLGAKMVSGQASWSLVMHDRDTVSAQDLSCDSPSSVRITTPIPASQVGQIGSGEQAQDIWVHLAAVFDANAQNVRLYINGQLAGTVTRTARWSAAGPFTIGRGLWATTGTAGSPTDFFPGRIDAVRVFQGALPASMISRNYLTEGGNFASTANRTAIASASSSTACQSSEGADKVFDGTAENNSKWCSSQASKWLQVNLPGQQTITSVVLWHAASGGESWTWNTKDFDIQTSTDGTTWTTRLQVRGSSSGVSRHTFASAVSAKHIKIVVVTPAQDTSTAARIYEVQVYTGTKAALSQATGSPACSTSEDASKVIDGVIGGSKWCSIMTTKWVQVQLASEETITSVVLWHACSGNEGLYWDTRDYDILTSTDGVGWSTALQIRGNGAAMTHHDLPYPTRAKYMKVAVINPTADSNTAARIYEIEVYK